MNVVVCIKPVISKYVNERTGNNNKWVINPYDLYVLNRMLQLKRESNRLHITCLSMGSIHSKEVLIRCLALGADEAVLLCDEHFAGSDTYATAYILAAAINKINYDIVACGKQTVDGETGQVGYGLAYRLHLLCFQQVEDILEIEKNTAIFTRVNEQYLEKLEVKLPVMLSFQKLMINCNVSLLMLKKVRSMSVQIWTHKDINLELKNCGSSGSKTKVLNIHQIFEKKNPIVINGSTKEKAEELLKIINGSIQEKVYE
jgi:electron transfer flavoprotein beta subunit